VHPFSSSKGERERYKIQKSDQRMSSELEEGRGRCLSFSFVAKPAVCRDSGKDNLVLSEKYVCISISLSRADESIEFLAAKEATR
jgi:hypothetical protein